MAGTIIKKLPADTRCGAVYQTPENGNYILANGVDHEKFVLWHETDGGYEKIKESKDPDTLRALIPWPTQFS